ncbi:DUF803-domain-containing protein [Fistulina hepatica ATCC 64428]|uniref:DUF803-domain-containing protein n=1 Tax=Fistulina hepatica ATCC 64428 TaxID=1128425 RepID=A0A0D7A2T3_9AGAR|nr:DUF803-domain-containing protein [Fistulina hepatica ATCC 64428]
MVDDKYIGLVLALSGSLAIGTSFIITKKGLNDAAENNEFGASASDNLSYLKNPIWWAGMVTIANFAAYTFAPPIMVTPLGSLSVLIGAVLASFLLGERLGHLGRLGCTMCLLGSLIIVLHAPEDTPVDSVEDMLRYAVQPGFLLYVFLVLCYTLVGIYYIVPRYGRTNPLVYISICSLVGSVSVMAIKGFGVAVKLTFGGKNQFIYPSTYFFGICVAGCIVVQMNYFNKALDTFSTNVVNPIYFVGFTSSTLVASLIMFQGFNTSDAGNAVSLLCGFIVTFIGVHLLNFSRQPELPLEGHSVLAGGMMNPRLSLQGRASIDGWSDMGAGAVPNGVPRSNLPHRTHRRSGSFPFLTTLSSSPDDPRGTEHVGLEQLREEETDDEGEVNERTRLQSSGSPPHGASSPQRNGSANHSPSPRPDGRR